MTKEQKSSIICSFSIKLSIFIFFLAGLFFSLFDGGKFNANSFLYYTIQSNIWIGLIALVFAIFDMVSLKRGEMIEKKNWLYILKFIATISICFTFLVFNFVLYPAMAVLQHNPMYFFKPNSLLLHVVVPVLAIVDFVKFDFKYKSTNAHMLFGFITPLYYVAFCYISSALGADFGDGAKFPYFFMDYQTNTWFEIGGGHIGTFYWILIGLALVFGISATLLKIKNVRRKAKFKTSSVDDVLK